MKKTCRPSATWHLTKLLVIAFMSLSWGAFIYAEEPEDSAEQSKTIEELADEVEDLQASIEELESRFDLGVDVSGYVDVEYYGSSDEGAKEGFRMHHLSLFFTKQFNDRMRFFSEIEYEDAPKFVGTNDGSGSLKEAEGKVFVEAVNFDYRYSQELSFRVGRFFTPVGIWSEDHYPPFVTTQDRPLHIRKIFPQLVDGASVYGTHTFGDDIFFKYVAYLGNGESKTSGKKDDNSEKAVGLRLNLHLPLADEFFFGLNAYKDSDETASGGADKFAWGLHGKLRIDNFTFQTEWAQSDLEYQDNLTADDEQDGFYFQTAYQRDKWTYGHRYDKFDDSALDMNDVTRNSVFANYQYNANVVLKFEHHWDNYSLSGIDNSSSYVFSIAAYLGR